MSDPLRVLSATDFKNDELAGAVDQEALDWAKTVISEIEKNDEAAVRTYAEQFGERTASEDLTLSKADLKAAFDRISESDQALLGRVADRIGQFATAQLESLSSLSVSVPGGHAGHTLEPIARVGCYAPGGRYPLPSTVLMTAVTARVAGCAKVVVASPNPTDITLAAAHVAGADEFLAIGGAHAIVGMARGFGEFKKCDLIAGPGNKWVTAAKQMVVGQVGIDMLAGPSELLVVADSESNPATLAADLIAQAEHDSDARPFLICFDEQTANSVNEALEKQLNTFPNAETAQQALRNGAIIVCRDENEALNVTNELAPEHLELHLANAQDFSAKVKNAGCVFIGSKTAEVFGDYGAGPNHTLPTGGSSRWSGGLNVFTFVRVRTWLKMDQRDAGLIDDTVALAEHEGLIGHARAAAARRER